MSLILELKNVSKEYPNFSLKNVSFSLESGYIMGFIGQNGSGKTTTIRAIMNAISRTSGEIKLFGKEIDANEVAVKERIGYVPDEDYFISNFDLRTHAKAMKMFYPVWNEQYFYMLLNRFMIPINQKTKDFSKGMKTKAMLALALAHAPELLILDEPTAGLDPVARIDVLDILREFVSDGTRSVLFSTHITSDLDKVADIVTLIDKGQIKLFMPMDKIEETYVLIRGNNEELTGHEEKFIGIRKSTNTFEGLLPRENANTYFKDHPTEIPNIENILTFSIWGNKV